MLSQNLNKNTGLTGSRMVAEIGSTLGCLLRLSSRSRIAREKLVSVTMNTGFLQATLQTELGWTEVFWIQREHTGSG